MSAWKPVNEKERYGVAIDNFTAYPEWMHSEYLDLQVGDLVEITHQYQEWYSGRLISRQTEAKGIFPKSYICIRECVVDRTGSVEVVSLVQAPIVQEITQTLKEWGRHWKDLYVSRGEQFKLIEVSMLTLLELRSAILTGTLPVDQIKKYERTAILTIDKGNRKLDMDLIVRSPNGKLIDPLEVSVCQLYNMHTETNKNVNTKTQETSSSQHSSSANTSSYSLFVSVRNFVCRMTEDAELLISLYDGTTHTHFTEKYAVRWSKAGLASDIDQIDNMRVVFTDLGLTDIKREKVYLVCFVVRLGGMDVQNSDSRRSTAISSNVRGISVEPQSSYMRRPFGVAAMDVTRTFSQHRQPGHNDDDNQQFSVPFVPFDRENLDSLLKRVITSKDLKPESKTDQGLWVSLKLINGNVQQFREDLPHLAVGHVAVARKMGFPEVILPGDARNDLYLSLVNGTFSKGGRSADMNIEVTVKVCSKRGEIIYDAISVGAGFPNRSEYNSVIYYHDNRPRWHEVFKVGISIEEFRQAHVVFLFRHRSSNEAKDKNEKHFAMAYTPLMQPNGTTLYDSQHNLCVYKVDHKKSPASEYEMALLYLSVPSARNQLITNEKEAKFQKGCLSLMTKDAFVIETKVCSTKLTQNESLLGVLNWSSPNPEHSLQQSLLALQSVPGSEIVKFLPDTLDALFDIMTRMDMERAVERDTLSGSFDGLVFKCVLRVIELVSDRNYHHFQPVLDLYIRENFFSTLAYKKLLEYLTKLVLIGGQGESSLLLRAMKCLEYLLRFVVRSRQLHAELTTKDTDKSFNRLLQGLLESMVVMMQCESDAVLTSQGACIKYLPSAVPFLMEVFPPHQLSRMIGQILGVLTKLTKQRLMSVLDLVQGPLFQDPSCTCILLPHITGTLRTLIQSNDEARHKNRLQHKTHRSGVEIRSVAKVARVLGMSKRKIQEDRGCNEQLELCVKIMSEMLTLLFKRERSSTVEEFKQIVKALLRTVLQSTTQMDRENGLMCQLVGVLLEMLRQMTLSQYLSYMEQFQTTSEALDFVTDVHMVLKDLVERPVFPEHWADMLNLQNSVVLSTLKLFSVSLVDQFLSPFQESAWSAWFSLSMSFVTSPLLQLERLTPKQRKRITSKYGDMRVDAALEITSMWAKLGPNKSLFVPGLVEPFLRMSLIPEHKLRDATIPLFFDMMQCSYETNLASGIGHFKQFENEMIHKLDVLVEGGQGDEQWRSMFVRIMGNACVKCSNLNEPGCRFVAVVGRLLDTLLQYRASHDQASVEHRMQATTTLLDFYSEIERPEMYIRYVNKLFSLHLESDSWTEAALTLRLHAKLLKWSAEPLQDRLRSASHPHCETHRHLKEALYYDMVHFLDEGKMWELSLEICRELSRQYEEEVFDYVAMPQLLRNFMAPLYEKILTQLRLQPEYFRVGYYGLGFPHILRNRVFVYRGKGCEKLEEFSNRIMNDVPKAELLSRLTPPTHEMLNSPHQYVQINAVEPVMCDRNNRMSGKPVSNQILSYYRYNNVSKFRFSRPFHKTDEALANKAGDLAQNEFSSLWLERTEIEISEKLPGILKWFPVVSSRTFEMSPLEVAIETMTEANKALRTLVLEYQADDNISLEPLSRKLQGLVDAAVMGGIPMYEKAFFTEDYLGAHPGHKQLVNLLKDLIAAQIPLLEFGVEVHQRRTASGNLAPFHQHIAEKFLIMKEHVQTLYGKKSCDLEQELATVTMRRQIQQNGSDQRWSQISSHTDHSTDSGIGSRNTNLTLRQAFTFNKQSNRGSFGSSSNTVGGSSNIKSPVGTVVGAMLNMSPVQPVRKHKDKRRNTRKCESANPLGVTSPPTASSQWYMGVPPPLRHTIHTNSPAPTQTQTLTTPATPSTPATPATQPVVELRQELTASRPLRSEVERERRLSQRPNSLQSCNSNRNSAGTTDSNASNEEELPPPPLPQKNSKSDTPLKIDKINGTQLDYQNNEIVQTLRETIVRDQDYSLVKITTDRTCVVDGITTRQNYDTVISPRGSFLYSSMHTPTSKTDVCLHSEKAPTPPPKKKNRSKQL